MEEAAGCYERAAEQYEITKSAHESARAYVEAAKCRKEVSPATAVDAFGKVPTFTVLLVVWLRYSAAVSCPGGKNDVFWRLR